jgi:capsular exopolysaccharide synthesis family protein
MAGKCVLLLDCDLRRAQATEYFNLRGKVGLTDVVFGHVEKREVFRRGELKNLIVVPAGTPNKHPPDLLASKRMLDFVAELREVFDTIVIDSPPASLVVDSSILMRMVDKAVFVVRWRETPREVVQRAVTSLADDPRKISGVVLNRVENVTASSYSGYYSYTNTGDGGYYSESS